MDSVSRVIAVVVGVAFVVGSVHKGARTGKRSATPGRPLTVTERVFWFAAGALSIALGVFGLPN